MCSMRLLTLKIRRKKKRKRRQRAPAMNGNRNRNKTNRARETQKPIIKQKKWYSTWRVFFSLFFFGRSIMMIRWASAPRFDCSLSLMIRDSSEFWMCLLSVHTNHFNNCSKCTVRFVRYPFDVVDVVVHFQWNGPILLNFPSSKWQQKQQQQQSA